jgi:osmoprotectant transport system permease protein
VIAAALAIPPALWLAHRRRAEFLANAVVNVGRAIPSFGVVVLLAVFWITRGWDFAFWPLVVALVLLAVPPMFTNAYAGVADVDPALVEAGRGMGLTERQVLIDVEVPAALPVLLAGVRIAIVQVVATVALGAVVTSRTGGLGVYIVNGFARLRDGGDVLVLAGAILVALLTLATERGFGLFERAILPRGLRAARHPAQPAAHG